jgi:hypothetical protein
MLHALLVLAASAEGHETSKTAFYLAGGVLAAFAVALSLLGLSRPDFGGTAAASRGVMAVAALLVLAAMATSIVTA